MATAAKQTKIPSKISAVGFLIGCLSIILGIILTNTINASPNLAAAGVYLAGGAISFILGIVAMIKDRGITIPSMAAVLIGLAGGLFYMLVFFHL